MSSTTTRPVKDFGDGKRRGVPYTISGNCTRGPWVVRVNDARGGNAATRERIEVVLAPSHDPNGRPQLFFPVVLRGGSNVTVEYLRDGVFRISGPFPTDYQLFTGGHARTLSRYTVGFFPHNGVWLGAPATVSVGARVRNEAILENNNLD